MPGAEDRHAGVLRVVEAFYDAATDLTKWDDCLDRLLFLFDATVCQLGYWDLENQRLGFNVHKGTEYITPGMWRRFQKLLPEDPRFEVWERLPGKPHSCRETIPVERLHASRVYKEILAPAHIEYTLGAKIIAEEDGSSAGIAVMRSKEGKAFDHQDTEAMGALIPHLKQALAIHKKFALLDFQNRAALETLDNVRTGIILLEEGGAIKFANKLAKNIAAARDGLAIINDRLSIANFPLLSDILATANTAIQRARQDDILPGKSFSIPRPSGKRPYMALVCPLWGNHLRFDLSVLAEPLAAIFVTDPERPLETPTEVLQRLFGLTVSEARLAARFAETASLKESAELLELTEGTARVYMKRIFAKTGVNSQAALMKLVLAGLAAPRPFDAT